MLARPLKLDELGVFPKKIQEEAIGAIYFMPSSSRVYYKDLWKLAIRIRRLAIVQ